LKLLYWDGQGFCLYYKVSYPPKIGQ
jgi:hypothetical protein